MNKPLRLRDTWSTPGIRNRSCQFLRGHAIHDQPCFESVEIISFANSGCSAFYMRAAFALICASSQPLIASNTAGSNSLGAVAGLFRLSSIDAAWYIG